MCRRAFPAVLISLQRYLYYLGGIVSIAKCGSRDEYRNALIVLALLNADRTLRYSASVPTTRWGEAIQRLLLDRDWTQKQLAEAASLRPNTLTNIIKHGKDTDTATLSRIAAAFEVDVAELFVTREQSQILRAYRENRIERLKDAVLKELSGTVARLVQQEFDRVIEPEGQHSGPAKPPPRKRPRKRRK